MEVPATTTLQGEADMAMDTAAWLTALSFAVQIAAGVAPMRWPQHVWIAGVIFWLSLAFALGCSAWWILSNQETAMFVIRSGYSVSALLVVLAGLVGWMEWRAADAAPSLTPPVAAGQQDHVPLTLDASTGGKISANKMEMTGFIPGNFAKAATGGQIIMDGAKIAGLSERSINNVEFPPPNGTHAGLSNKDLSKGILQSAEKLRRATNRSEWSEAAFEARDLCAEALPKIGPVASVGPGSKLLAYVYVLDKQSANAAADFLDTVSNSLQALP